MCWSMEVSAVFAALDFMVATCLYYRKANRRDILYSGAMVLIGLQEALQGVLWAHIDSCDDTHKQWIRVLMAVVWAIPVANVCLFATGSDVPLPRAIWPVLAFIAAGAVGLWAAALIEFGLAEKEYRERNTVVWGTVPSDAPASLCIQVGPNGHQVWPSVWFSLAYFLPNAAIALAVGPWFTPSLPLFATAGIGSVGSVILVATVSLDEFTSVWCWSASVLGAYFLMEPWILHQIEKYHKAKAN